jgi:hypothetical protein
MNVSTTIDAPSKAFLSGWERALLALPALAGLVLGLLPIFVPTFFAQVTGFPATDFYLYQLAGSATVGYGVALSIAVFQKHWLTVRLPVIGVLVFNLGSLYACTLQIFTGYTPYSLYIVLASSILFVIISAFLLLRHQGVPHEAPNLASLPLRILLIIGAAAAGVFGLAPLFAPNLFTFFHMITNDHLFFLARLAGAASLGYAVMAILGQRALNTREMFLSGTMAAIFNGVGGIVSIPYILSGTVLYLPWLIGPVGILVLLACLIALRQALQVIKAGAPDSETNE